MIFGFFAIGVAVVFFVGCLIMLDYGRRLGLLYLRRNARQSAWLDFPPLNPPCSL